MRRIVLLAAFLLPAGCSSLDSIPLSDVPIPEAAPRVAAEPLAPTPPARPQTPSASSVGTAVESAASVALAPSIEEPIAAPTKSTVKSAGEAIVAAVDTLLSPIQVMAFADEAPGGALTSDGALYRSGLVERREVGGTVKPLEPESGRAPAAADPAIDLTPASFGEVTLSRIEIPGFSARTFIWVMIGFAALLGLFISARQIRD